MPVVNLHFLLCVVAIILGVLIFAGAVHVSTLHAGVGFIVVVIGVLAAL